MDCILGIDQGASGTRTLLADTAGRILSCGAAGGGNQSVSGLPEALEEIRKAAEQAIRAAGEDAELKAVGAGIAGCDFPCEYEMLRGKLEDIFHTPARVVNDCMAALRAESSAGGSAVICVGSGLNIGLKAKDGRKFCLGYYIDDAFQGGESIARQALRRVYEADLGIAPATALTGRILRHFGKQSVEQLMEWLIIGEGKSVQADLKYLAPVVDECALEGDPAAAEILAEFGRACSRYAAGGMARLGMLEDEVTFYLSGGIFKFRSSVLKDTVTAGLLEANRRTVVRDAVYEPVVGAALIGLETFAGGALPEQAAKQLHENAGTIGLVRQNGN